MYSKGLQQGLVTLDKDFYDEEQTLRDEMVKAERNIRKKNKNVTDETIDMMVDDYMEEAHNIQEIDDEVYDMEYMDEDFFNGNTDGTDAPETDYNDYYDDA
jgi:hypothetical protein